jgi:hypothetical protein
MDNVFVIRHRYAEILATILTFPARVVSSHYFSLYLTTTPKMLFADPVAFDSLTISICVALNVFAAAMVKASGFLIGFVVVVLESFSDANTVAAPAHDAAL